MGYIESLHRERLGYIARNLPLRVAEVDALLRLAGVEVESASMQPDVEKAVRSKPRAHTATTE